MPKESALQSKCLKYAREQGIICGKIDMASIRGWPDTLLLFPNGRTTYIEFKLPNGSLRPEQDRTIKRMKGNKADVRIVKNFDNFRAIVSVRLQFPAIGHY